MTFDQNQLAEKIESILRDVSGQASYHDICIEESLLLDGAGMERDENKIVVYLSNGQRIRVEVHLESDG